MLSASKEYKDIIMPILNKMRILKPRDLIT